VLEKIRCGFAEQENRSAPPIKSSAQWIYGA
jgi:hypothetical protein